MQASPSDVFYMQRCLALAARGRSTVAPNPMVGAVVVCDGQVIGEGWHRKAGTPHAEVHAIAAVKDKSLLSKSTIYVSLEPCAHYGKTPPCAHLIVAHQLARVVVACEDPFPAVAGKGIAHIRAAGIPVTVGVCEKEALELNRFFITAHIKKRPYVILKWAESTDGFIAPASGSNKAISGAWAQLYNHQWRTEVDAIAVGFQTALQDNPQLTPRRIFGKTPLRLVFDPKGALPADLSLFTDGHPTWQVVEDRQTGLQQSSVAVVQLNFQGTWVLDLMRVLHERGVQSLLVEGGAKTLQQFFAAGVVDEVRRFKARRLFLGSGIAAPQVLGGTIVASKDLDGDVLERMTFLAVGS